MKKRTKKIPISTVYQPPDYANIRPGTALVSMTDGKLWKAIEASEEGLCVIPYSGGCVYAVPAETSTIAFGEVSLPLELKNRIALP